MTTEQIETIRKALEQKYDFPYYSLIRVHTRHNGTFHIPAPMFNGMSKRAVWAGNLPIAQDKRDGEYYECPFCGEKSFYAGVCRNCEGDYDILAYHTDEWEVGCMPERYRLQNMGNHMRRLQYENHEAVKTAVKEEFLRRLDSGLELGIISAEIVLSDGPYDHCETQSPFLKRMEYRAEEAINYIDRVIRSYARHQEREEYEKVIREYVPDGIPIDYIEGEEIEVEGSDEKMRFLDDMWQHMHGDYCYWHPMARIHKEDR